MADVAARFTHMGPPGSGLVAKMVNQLHRRRKPGLMAEALAMAETAGIRRRENPRMPGRRLRRQRLPAALLSPHGSRDFAAQGYARQMLKDLEMLSEYAGGLKSPLPMAGRRSRSNRMLVHAGHAELDSGAIYKLYER
jgi:3-hydroxyisobutyrate dehydrogenase-like beta-hydroxyacid dehydrogenase